MLLETSIWAVCERHCFWGVSQEIEQGNIYVCANLYTHQNVCKLFICDDRYLSILDCAYHECFSTEKTLPVHFEMIYVAWFGGT